MNFEHFSANLEEPLGLQGGMEILGKLISSRKINQNGIIYLHWVLLMENDFCHKHF